MKKVFALMAIAALVCTVSCNKDDKGGKNHNNGGEESEYVAPITIDGDFADWAKLDASKIAKAECVAGATKDDLKLVKVYFDSDNIFVYTEFEVGELDAEGDLWIPFHFYLNADNSAATGGDSQQFTDKDAEWMFETSITSYDPGLFKWWGAVGADGWLWTPHDADNSLPEHSADDNWGAIMGEGSGIGSSAGTIDRKTGKGAYEIQIQLAMMPGVEFADVFTVGFDIQINWSTTGILPNAADGELAPKLKVTRVK
ncbi:MAG: hypothetical protein IJK44_03150 [Bacteroidales bacterium]|nr:hypothetical protein [Bacteroidales bacterium]